CLLRERSPRPPPFPYTPLFRSTPLRMQALLAGTHRRLAVVLAVLGLGGALAVHHGVPAALATGATHGEHATAACPAVLTAGGLRSEEHTSELQSRENLVCRLLL